MKKIYSLAAFLALTAYAHANWSLLVDIDGLRDQSGSFTPPSTLVLIVADISGNGFSTPLTDYSTAINSGWGADDTVIGRFNDTLNDTPGVFSVQVDGADVYAGKNIALYWFSTLDLTATTLSNGLSYGTTSSLNTEWVAPAVGATDSITFLGANSTGTLGSGSYTNTQMSANLTITAVPEPATYAALFGLAAVGFCAWRKRRVA
jgi:hypothetical protein